MASSSASSSAACASCHEPLVFENDDGIAVPDDVFVSECLIEHGTQIVESTLCPVCAKPIVDAGACLVQYTNEGGVQSGLDMYRHLVEEAFYEKYPGKLPGRAFLGLCAEGDVEAMMQLYVEHAFGGGDEEDDDDMDDMDDMDDGDDDKSAEVLPAAAMLRHQDPVNDMDSGLHLAIANGHVHAAYLVLYLASDAALGHLPAELQQFVASIPRPTKDVQEHGDVRALMNARGQLPKQVALEKGGAWAQMAASGLLDAPF